MTTSWRERMGHYRTEDGARAYREKHRRTFLRRIADRREQTLLHRMLDRIGAFDSVLDCPCGAGRFLPGLAARARDLCGIDQSPALAAMARETAAAVAVGDAGALPLRSGCVDVVICMRLLHHFPESADRLRMFRELGRVARKGVVISFADADTWRGARSRSRRIPLARAQLAEEAAATGLELDPNVLSVNGLFSRFSFALLRIRQN
ncbi:MAG: class I SAM-dependent methyltransferase [Planctomycetota bacterium]|jgi:SAM-dependent methyltransferase